MDATFKGMRTEVIALEKRKIVQVVNKRSSGKLRIPWNPDLFHKMGRCE